MVVVLVTFVMVLMLAGMIVLVFASVPEMRKQSHVTANLLLV